jgi:hypothetical protein
MKEINLRELIEDVISKFSQNRTGLKPLVFATIPPDLPQVYWEDERLERFVKYFLYHALLTHNPERPLHIIVHERTKLADLEGFVGVSPLYWIQLRIQGYGSSMIESMVKEIFNDYGYRCEEWIGLEGSDAQLAIFSPSQKGHPKMVFCSDASRAMQRCDFLIPVSERQLLPSFADPSKKT